MRLGYDPLLRATPKRALYMEGIMWPNVPLLDDFIEDSKIVIQ